MASYNQLIGDPTLVRAVLMASASHGLPGYPRVPIYSDNVDDRGGAGAPRGDRAQAIMDNGQYLTKNVNYDTDFDSNGNFTTPITFDMKKDDIARIVLTYDQCQAGTISVADSLIADLDLSVTEDSMSPVVTSLSNNSHYDNTEILEFEVRNAARVHVFVRAQHWEPCGDGRKTYMAVAWDVHPGPGPIIGD